MGKVGPEFDSCCDEAPRRQSWRCQETAYLDGKVSWQSTKDVSKGNNAVYNAAMECVGGFGAGISMACHCHGVKKPKYTMGLLKIRRILLLIAYYVLGLNPTEAFLFVPTVLFLVVPGFVYPALHEIAKRFITFAVGRYTAKNGLQYDVSAIGCFGDLKFSKPLALDRKGHGHSFPSPKALSCVNAQVFQKCISLAYEEWGLVKDVFERWSTDGLEAEFVAGYVVSSVSWEEKHDDGAPQRYTVDLGNLRAFIVKINNAAILSFEGTNPFNVSALSIDWDIYSKEEVGKFGRIHPGFRSALGLNKDLEALGNGTIRTTVSITASSEGSTAAAVVNTSMYELLAGKLRQVCDTDPRAEVYVVGHSLGGAMAAVFTTALSVAEPDSGCDGGDWISPKVKGLFTIGQPRTGDFHFASEVAGRLNDSPQDPRFIRVVNVNDIVPALPPPGSADLGETSYQHSGYIVYISAFGGLYPLVEQPVITAGLVVLVSLISAVRVSKQWLAPYFPSHGECLNERPSVLLVAAKWLIFLLLLLPHGIAQHIPANYSLAIENSHPKSWVMRSEKAEPKGALQELRQVLNRQLGRTTKAARKSMPGGLASDFLSRYTYF